MEINVSGYANGKILSQLTSDDLLQKHPAVFFFRRMISTETWYKTQDDKLLAIVETFKI